MDHGIYTSCWCHNFVNIRVISSLLLWKKKKKPSKTKNKHCTLHNFPTQFSFFFFAEAMAQAMASGFKKYKPEPQAKVSQAHGLALAWPITLGLAWLLALSQSQHITTPVICTCATAWEMSVVERAAQERGLTYDVSCLHWWPQHQTGTVESGRTWEYATSAKSGISHS